MNAFEFYDPLERAQERLNEEASKKLYNARCYLADTCEYSASFEDAMNLLFYAEYIVKANLKTD